jgi:predicted acylesterase/phospholipase RssA
MSLPIRALALGGGGIKGILHVGALQELSKRQPLLFPDGVYGSSIGSIIATYVAFQLPIESASSLIRKYLSMDAILPSLNFQSVSSAFSAKGLHTMDKFEQNIIHMFQDCGVDIQTKRMSDASMPFYIVASNITKGVPTVFSGDVSVIDAIKASCCMPGIFRPQTIFDQLYIDGDVFVPNIGSLVPQNALVIILPKQRRHTFTPSLIESMSPMDYIAEIYSMSKRVIQDSYTNVHCLRIRYPELHSDSDLTGMNVEDILDSAGKQLNGFLASKIAQ